MNTQSKRLARASRGVRVARPPGPRAAPYLCSPGRLPTGPCPPFGAPSGAYGRFVRRPGGPRSVRQGGRPYRRSRRIASDCAGYGPNPPRPVALWRRPPHRAPPYRWGGPVRPRGSVRSSGSACSSGPVRPRGSGTSPGPCAPAGGLRDDPGGRFRGDPGGRSRLFQANTGTRVAQNHCFPHELRVTGQAPTPHGLTIRGE